MTPLPHQPGAAALPAAGVSEEDPRPAAACLAVLRQLEATLQLGQKALLAYDLSAIEFATSEQARLRQEFETLWAWGIPRADTDAAELRAAQQRILHLGKTQAALLSRAQRYLNVLARLHAGANAAYSATPSDRVLVAEK